MIASQMQRGNQTTISDGETGLTNLVSFTNTVTYTLAAVATNRNGDSSPDGTVFTVIPVGSPLTPVGNVVVGDKTMTVSIQNPNPEFSNGSDVTNYKISIYDTTILVNSYDPMNHVTIQIPKQVLFLNPAFDADFGNPYGINATTLYPFTINSSNFNAIANGTPYNLIIQASNAIGSSSILRFNNVIPRAPPSAPTFTVASPHAGEASTLGDSVSSSSGKIEAVVDKLTGEDRGGDTEAFTYTFLLYNGSNLVQTKTINEPSDNVLITADFTGLVDGTSYTVKAKVKNSFGEESALITYGTTLVPSVAPTVTSDAAFLLASVQRTLLSAANTDKFTVNLKDIQTDNGGYGITSFDVAMERANGDRKAVNLPIPLKAINNDVVFDGNNDIWSLIENSTTEADLDWKLLVTANNAAYTSGNTAVDTGAFNVRLSTAKLEATGFTVETRSDDSTLGINDIKCSWAIPTDYKYTNGTSFRLELYEKMPTEQNDGTIVHPTDFSLKEVKVLSDSTTSHTFNSTYLGSKYKVELTTNSEMHGVANPLKNPVPARDYMPSTNVTVGAVKAADQYNEEGLMWNTSGTPFQINLLRNKEVTAYTIQNPPDGSVEYWNGDRATDMTTGNWTDPQYYSLKIDMAGNMNVYTYQGATVVEPATQWTITGWGQTVLRGSVEVVGGVTKLVVKDREYRAFPNDLNVNPQESFVGQMYTEVASYSFTGGPGDLAEGTQLTVEIDTSYTGPEPVGGQKFTNFPIIPTGPIATTQMIQPKDRPGLLAEVMDAATNLNKLTVANNGAVLDAAIVLDTSVDTQNILSDIVANAGVYENGVKVGAYPGNHPFTKFKALDDSIKTMQSVVQFNTETESYLALVDGYKTSVEMPDGTGFLNSMNGLMPPTSPPTSVSNGLYHIRSDGYSTIWNFEFNFNFAIGTVLWYEFIDASNSIVVRNEDETQIILQVETGNVYTIHNDYTNEVSISGVPTTGGWHNSFLRNADSNIYYLSATNPDKHKVKVQISQ